MSYRCHSSSSSKASFLERTEKEQVLERQLKLAGQHREQSECKDMVAVSALYVQNREEVGQSRT